MRASEIGTTICFSSLLVACLASPFSVYPFVAGRRGCVAAGHFNICCVGRTACLGEARNCYCDQGCFARNDCCSDIYLTSCRPSECYRAGWRSQCCTNKFPSVHCRTTRGCYCDRACHRYNDCCDRIEDTCPSSASSIQQRLPLFYPYSKQPVDAIRGHFANRPFKLPAEQEIMEEMLLNALMKEAAQHPISSPVSDQAEKESIKKLTEAYMMDEG